MMLRIEMAPWDNYDLSNNPGYATVELTSIYNDPNTWPHKVILPSFLEKGKAFLSRKQDVDPGTYPVYVGMKLTNYCFVDMGFDIDIYEDATNKRLFHSTFILPSYQNLKTQCVGQLQINPSPTTVTLTLIVWSHGSVKVTLPDRTEVKPPGNYTYTVQSGTWVTFDATPDAGYYFDGYYVSGIKVWSSTSYSTWVVTNTSIEARFTASQEPPPGTYVLTYNVGPNGTLYIDDVAYRDTSGQKTYASGVTVKLEAKPDSGYRVDRFTVDGAAVGSTSTTITMDANHSVDASFAKLEKTDTTTTDVGEVINKIMNSMLPPMMTMMGMMMTMSIMMSMMTGMVQSLAGAMAA